MKEIFRTAESLREAINDPNQEKYFDRQFAYSLFDLDGDRADQALDGELFPVPYWITSYYNKVTEWGDPKYWAQYCNGIYEPLNIGERRHIEKGSMCPAGIYEYVDSQPLDSDIEYQSDDGALVYEHRGYSFLRIWGLVE